MTDPRVLVVDDHFVFAQAIAAAIGQVEGFELIGIAVTGPQALAMAREHLPDVVLLDFHLPGYAADSLIPRIRDAAPGARIVVLTSDVSERAMAAAMDAGADVFITKDKAFEDVIDALRATPRETGAVAPPPPAPVPAAPAPTPTPAEAPPPASLASTPELDEASDGDEPSNSDDDRERVLVRVAGAGSFARAALLEGFLAGLPQVYAVHIREIDGELASLRVVLAPERSIDDLADALGDAPFALEPGARAPGALDVVAPRAGRAS